MALQGHDAGATSQEGACENSNLEHQGCSPFYQDVADDPYVDPVSGLRALKIMVHYYFLPFAFLSSSFLLLLVPQDI